MSTRFSQQFFFDGDGGGVRHEECRRKICLRLQKKHVFNPISVFFQRLVLATPTLVTNRILGYTRPSRKLCSFSRSTFCSVFSSGKHDILFVCLFVLNATNGNQQKLTGLSEVSHLSLWHTEGWGARKSCTLMKSS